MKRSLREIMSTRIYTGKNRRIARLCFWLGVILLVGAFFFLLTQPTFVFSRSPAGDLVDPSRLEDHVRILSETYYPRSVNHPENLDAAAHYIAAEFRQSGGDVGMQSFEIGETTYRNVCASFGPQSGPRIIVGAHYDSPGNSPGADDNASGTAGLIELARLLGKTPPSAHVEVVAYALEEAYFGTTKMGSSFHARYLKGSKQNVKLMICLEMIGYFRDDPGSQRYPSLLMGLLYPSRGNFIAIVGRAGEWSETRRIKAAMKRSTALPVRSVNAPFPVPGIDLSDHLSYWREGFPAVMITDTAYMRNMNYHSDGDTADTLDYGRMAMAVEGVYAAVMELAGSGTGDRGTGTGE